MIPGISDGDIGELLTRAKEAGAGHAAIVFLRLPGSVKEVFEERLRETLPLRANRVLALVRDARGGALYDPRWERRQTGEGAYAESVMSLFESTARRLGLLLDDDDDDEELEEKSTFERPTAQLELWKK
jgi:DNA repair photolyase